MKKILCFRNSRLGDYLISLPSLKLIKQENNDSKIYYLSDKSDFYKSLPTIIEKNKIVDKFIFFKNNFFSHIKLFFLLRSLKFDIVYYLQENTSKYREIRDFIFFNLLNIKIKRGFFIKKKNYKNFNESIQLAHRVSRKLKKFDFEKLSKISPDSTKPLFNFKYITISTGGFSQPKIWKKNYWSILLRLILKRYKYKIIILGTYKDIEVANFLSLINKKKILNMCNKTNLKELFNIIQFSDMHITNDNGSMHVASLFEKKTICLFNNHDPEGKWYPSNKNATILRSNMGVDKIKPYKVHKNFLKLIKFI